MKWSDLYTKPCQPSRIETISCGMTHMLWNYQSMPLFEIEIVRDPFGFGIHIPSRFLIGTYILEHSKQQMTFEIVLINDFKTEGLSSLTRRHIVARLSVTVGTSRLWPEWSLNTVQNQKYDSTTHLNNKVTLIIFVCWKYTLWRTMWKTGKIHFLCLWLSAYCKSTATYSMDRQCSQQRNFHLSCNGNRKFK